MCFGGTPATDSPELARLFCASCRHLQVIGRVSKRYFSDVKLDYEAEGEASGTQRFARAADDRVIEISIHDQHDDETFCVVALSGQAGQQPDRQRCLGPFHSREQARGAMAALSNALNDEGFVVQEQAVLHWQLVAARVARAIRQERAENAVDTRFVPLGILPDHDP